MADIESKVPDIGGHGDVPVIEILVAVGDTVKKDQGLVTLESDKATMEVPAIADGVVKALKVKLGDVVSEGALTAERLSKAARLHLHPHLSPQQPGPKLRRPGLRPPRALRPQRPRRRPRHPPAARPTSTARWW